MQTIEPKRLNGPGSTAASDLFFNTDFSQCALTNGAGQFVGYDEQKLLEEAQSVAACVNSLGNLDFTAEELVADFYARQ